MLRLDPYCVLRQCGLCDRRTGHAAALFGAEPALRQLQELRKPERAAESASRPFDVAHHQRRRSAITASCPRFHELAFTVPAEHLGHKGKLWLTFVNERLLGTIFMPQDFQSYLEALRRSGVAVTDQGVIKIPPATEISIPMAAPMGVGWQDERFGNQVSAYIGACS